jgi:hypothetical protein
MSTTMNDPSNLLIALRLAEKRAELAYYQVKARRLEAELSDDKIDTYYNPAWKKGVHLTPLGLRAVVDAYKSGLRPVDVAQQFRVSETTALAWRMKIKTK